MCLLTDEALGKGWNQIIEEAVRLDFFRVRKRNGKGGFLKQDYSSLFDGICLD
jgi:hypothetical protein